MIYCNKEIVIKTRIWFIYSMECKMATLKQWKNFSFSFLTVRKLAKRFCSLTKPRKSGRFFLEKIWILMNYPLKRKERTKWQKMLTISHLQLQRIISSLGLIWYKKARNILIWRMSSSTSLQMANSIWKREHLTLVRTFWFEKRTTAANTATRSFRCLIHRKMSNN